MDPNNNNYTDNSFNLYQAYSYTLLLKVELTSFGYAVVYQNKVLVSAQNCALDELAHPKQLSDLLSATYKKVIIALPATSLTLVPKKLFSDSLVPDYARFLDVKENEHIFAQALDAENNIIYKTPGDIAAAVEKFGFQNSVYAAEGWLQAIIKSNPPSDNLYIEVGKTQVHFLNFSGSSIRFYNIFEFDDDDDLVYFTALVAGELRLQPQSTTLILSGNINADDKNLKRLAEFFPKIEINALKILELPGQIPSHKLLALAALSLCGSSEAH
jgi:hypothetical protein